jgi:hypothetical protein
VNISTSPSPDVEAILAELDTPTEITNVTTRIIGSGYQSLEVALERIDRQTADGAALPPAVSVLFDAPPYSGGNAEIHPSEIPALIDALTEIHQQWRAAHSG